MEAELAFRGVEILWRAISEGVECGVRGISSDIWPRKWSQCLRLTIMHLMPMRRWAGCFGWDGELSYAEAVVGSGTVFDDSVG